MLGWRGSHPPVDDDVAQKSVPSAEVGGVRCSSAVKDSARLILDVTEKLVMTSRYFFVPRVCEMWGCSQSCVVGRQPGFMQLRVTGGQQLTAGTDERKGGV